MYGAICIYILMFDILNKSKPFLAKVYMAVRYIPLCSNVLCILLISSQYFDQCKFSKCRETLCKII